MTFSLATSRTKSILTLLVFGVSLTLLPFAQASFKDVPNTDEHYLAINYLSDAKIFSGYSDGTFQSNKTLNKAESLKIVLESTGTKIDDGLVAGFSDVKNEDWFAKYVATGKAKQIVSGNPNGTFSPGKTVSRAEFMKMLLINNNFKTDNWKDQQVYSDVPKTAWFAPYMNFAGTAGLLPRGKGNTLDPNKAVTRGEAAEVLYLLRIILKGNDVAFLVSQSEAQITQVEVYMNAYNVDLAKHASDLAVDMTQQALKQRPDDKVVLSAAKIAKSYSLLLLSFIAGHEKNKANAIDLANQATTKADEALKQNDSLKDVVKHIKDRATSIKNQVSKL